MQKNGRAFYFTVLRFVLPQMRAFSRCAFAHGRAFSPGRLQIETAPMHVILLLICRTRAEGRLAGGFLGISTEQRGVHIHEPQLMPSQLFRWGGPLPKIGHYARHCGKKAADWWKTAMEKPGTPCCRELTAAALKF